MDDTRLSEIEARAARATPGPWGWDDFGDQTIVDSLPSRKPGRQFYDALVQAEAGLWVATTSTVILDGFDPSDTADGQTTQALDAITIDQADADFITHAREDIPALLDEVRRLQAINDQTYMDGQSSGHADIVGIILEAQSDDEDDETILIRITRFLGVPLFPGDECENQVKISTE